MKSGKVMPTLPPHAPRFNISFPKEETMSTEAHILHLKSHVPWWLPWVTFVVGATIAGPLGYALGVVKYLALVAHAAGG